jgi:rod shape-determining protein MreC
MTSGDDGVFPRGIAVGQAGIAPDRQWRIRLASSNSPIDFVRVIPPSNFPPPLDPVTPPILPPAPTKEEAPVPVQGSVMPLAAGAAAVPAAATPEAIRAAQASSGRDLEAARAAKSVQRQKKGPKKQLMPMRRHRLYPSVCHHLRQRQGHPPREHALTWSALD